MSPHHIIVESFIRLKALYEDLLSPYSFILDQVEEMMHKKWHLELSIKFGGVFGVI
jgi:hypothetical protein